MQARVGLAEVHVRPRSCGPLAVAGTADYWVLAFPAELRFLLARDEALLAKLRELFLRSVRAWQRAKAARWG